MCEIWDNFMKIWYFVNNFYIKVCIYKNAFAHYVARLIVIICRTPHFVST